jgi:hypothetical protein
VIAAQFFAFVASVGFPLEINTPAQARYAVPVHDEEQTEDIGDRLLARTSPLRVVAATAAAALVFALAGATVAWHMGQVQLQEARGEWLREQANPRLAALLGSEEGKAGLQLAELGVAQLLAKCSGRRSWRIKDGYCIPVTPQGLPDGFRVSESRGSRGEGA